MLLLIVQLLIVIVLEPELEIHAAIAAEGGPGTGRVRRDGAVRDGKRAAIGKGVDATSPRPAYEPPLPD